MAVTIRDIASKLGVSHMTVSRALSGSDVIAADTRRRVLDAAREVGYLPHASARALSKGPVDSIGLLVSTAGPRSIIAGMLPGIHQAIRERHLQLTLAELPDAELTDAGFVPRILREYSVAGFLISYTHETPPAMTDLIDRHRVPSVWMNKKRPHSCIYPDDEHATSLLTRHLLELGHRRIAYFTHQCNDHYSHADRFAGYAKTMRAAGLEVIDHRSSRYLVDDALARHTRAALDGENRPTAFVCYESTEATNLAAAALERGLRLPRDLSIVCVSEPVPALLGLTFTTALIPFVEVGRRAVEMLLAEIENGEPAAAGVAVRGHIIHGNSTAPPA